MLEVYVRRENGTSYQIGTGYLLDGSLVLTAAHVLSDRTAGPIIVRRPGDGRDWPCILLWRRYDEPGDSGRTRVDAALLRIAEPTWTEPAGLSPLSWGRLVTDQPDVPVVLAGLPTGMAARHDDGTLTFRDVTHGSGTVDTRGGPGGRLPVTLSHPIPAVAGEKLRWKGASGTAVLVSGSVVGIVVVEPKPGGRWLQVVPVTELAADTGFRDHVGPIDFAPAELRPVLAVGGPRRAYSPVSLLSAEAAVVRFHGRDELVDELTSWCDEDRAFSVRLVIGSGGQGKTRLARHLTALLRGRGWSAGFLGDRADTGQLSVIGRVATSLLLVVDYAEDRADQLVALAKLLSRAVSAPGCPRVRLLLLARAAGEWWDRLRQDAPLLRELSPRTVIPLPALEPIPAARSTALSEAVEDLGTRLGEVAGHTRFDPAAVRALALPDVSPDRFSCALNLHMTGLVALLQAADPVDAGKDEDDEAILLRHEQKFWKRTSVAFDLDDLDVKSRRKLVGAAILCQADDRAEADAVLDRLGVADDRPSFRDRVARWLASLYPADNAYWGPLQPDRLGEYLVSIVTDAVPDLLERLLPGAPQAQALRAMRTLARADAHRPGMAAKLRRLVTGHADPLAFTAVEAATTVEHPDPLRLALTAVTGDDATDVELLFRLYDSTPLETQALARWAMELAERLTVEARAVARDDRTRNGLSELARRLNNYAIRLAAAGRDTESLEVSQESVTHRRRLAVNGTVRELHDLALSLNTYTGSLTDTGRLADALATAEEVERLCRTTAELDPSDLAMALYSLAVRQGDVGQLAEAVGTAEEALRLYRELADDDPATHLPDVAMALDNYALCLLKTSQHKLAVAAAAEAVAQYQKLAAGSPDAYLGDVARTLSTQALGLTELGRHNEAIDVAAESVRLYRRLTDATSETDPTWLASALTAHATCLSNMDRDSEALVLYGEVLTIERGRYGSAPDVYRAQYARALGNYAVALHSVGREGEALPLYDEALSLFQRLIKSLPHAYDDELPRVLSNFAYCLMTLDEPRRALEAADEAVAVCRRLVADEADAHLASLVSSLRVRLEALRAMGQSSAALESIDEAIPLQRRLVARNSDVELVTLAYLLDDRVDLLAECGHRAAAVAAADEDVAITRRLAGLDDEEYGPVLARSLNRYAVMLSEASRHGDMLPVVDEALDRWRGLVTDDPDQFRSGLGIALHLLAVGLSQAGRLDEALEATEEAVRLFQEPARDDPETYFPLFVSALGDQAVVLTEAGRAIEALAVAERALELGDELDELAGDMAEVHGARARALSMLRRHDESLVAAETSLRAWRDLANADPVMHQHNLALMLRTKAELLASAGRPAEARTAADGAVALLSQLASTENSAFATDLAKALVTRHEVGDDR